MQKLTVSSIFLFAAILTISVVPVARAGTQAVENIAVYSGGFVVDTRRQSTIEGAAERVDVWTKGHGTAKGELPMSETEIHRLDQGTSMFLDPQTGT